MNVFVDGFAVAGYKSFGPELQLIGPFSKINIFAGQNNSGKSNILSFIRDHYTQAVEATRRTPRKWVVQATDTPVGDETGVFLFGVGYPADGEHAEAIRRHEAVTRLGREGQRGIEQLLNSDALRRNTDLVWFIYSGRLGQQLSLQNVDDVAANVGLPDHVWNALWQRFTNQSGGSKLSSWVPELLNTLASRVAKPPEVAFVPAIRQVAGGESTEHDFSGTGIIDRLAQLQNPGFENLAAKKRFAAVNAFVREIVGDPSAYLEVPYARNMILVHIGGRTLPLQSLGTGIQEVIILASVATVVDNQIVCMEEPELHLHPVLQRKLLRYLATKTSNQYFITTHSAHLLDSPGAAVFHVRLEEGRSVIAGAFKPGEKAAIATDLGYRASDLLQTNCVIWVEGPSDRIYIRWWLADVAPDLVEGLHYTIMFYGGRLLAQLTANDPDVTEFISLRRINRNMAIVIDSDKKASKGRINDTKRRVRDELEASGGVAWITYGKEIENYISHERLSRAVGEVHPTVVKHAVYGPFDAPLDLASRSGTSLMPDKVRIAKTIANGPADLSAYDLAKQVRRLEAFVRSANPDV